MGGVVPQAGPHARQGSRRGDDVWSDDSHPRRDVSRRETEARARG